MAEWEQPTSSQPLWQESCLSRVLELTGLSPAVNCFPLPECSEKSCSRGGEHRLCARGVRREPQQPGDAAVPGEAGKCFALLCQWFLLCSHPHLGTSCCQGPAGPKPLASVPVTLPWGYSKARGSFWRITTDVAWHGLAPEMFILEFRLLFLSDVSLTFIICCRLIQFPCRSGRGFPTGCARPFL